MTHAKRRSRVLGLMLLSMVGSMVLVVTDAKAITWDSGGSELTGSATVLGETIGFSSMLVPAQNLAVQCAFGPVTGFLFTNNTAHVTLIPLGCKAFIKGVENKNCAPSILSVNAIVKPILHSGTVYLLSEALTAGKPLTIVHYNEATCALPVLPEVKGTVVLECYTGALAKADCKTGRVKQLLRPVSEGLFFDGLVYGLNPATVHGEAEASLGGPLVGKTWNALI